MHLRFITIASQGRSDWKQYLSGTLLTYGVAFAILFPTIMLGAHLSGLSGEQSNIVIYESHLAISFSEELEVPACFWVFILPSHECTGVGS